MSDAGSCPARRRSWSGSPPAGFSSSGTSCSTSTSSEPSGGSPRRAPVPVGRRHAGNEGPRRRGERGVQPSRPGSGVEWPDCWAAMRGPVRRAECSKGKRVGTSARWSWTRIDPPPSRRGDRPQPAGRSRGPGAEYSSIPKGFRSAVAEGDDRPRRRRRRRLLRLPEGGADRRVGPGGGPRRRTGRDLRRRRPKRSDFSFTGAARSSPRTRGRRRPPSGDVNLRPTSTCGRQGRTSCGRAGRRRSSSRAARKG